MIVFNKVKTAACFDELLDLKNQLFDLTNDMKTELDRLQTYDMAQADILSELNVKYSNIEQEYQILDKLVKLSEMIIIQYEIEKKNALAIGENYEIPYINRTMNRVYLDDVRRQLNDIMSEDCSD